MRCRLQFVTHSTTSLEAVLIVPSVRVSLGSSGSDLGIVLHKPVCNSKLQIEGVPLLVVSSAEFCSHASFALAPLTGFCSCTALHPCFVNGSGSCEGCSFCHPVLQWCETCEGDVELRADKHNELLQRIRDNFLNIIARGHCSGNECLEALIGNRQHSHFVERLRREA